MIKRTMLAGLVAAFAFAAVPALSSAVTLTPATQQAFTVHGTNPTLGTTSGGTPLGIKCTTVEGSGSITDKTGNVHLSFEGCKDEVFGFSCTTPGYASGTITATATAHLETVNGNPAVLIKPTTGEAFAEFECFILGDTVTGNGIIGTITSPGINEKSTEATVSFEKGEGISQKHTKVDGDETTYGLEESVNGEPAEPAYWSSGWSLTFENEVELME